MALATTGLSCGQADLERVVATGVGWRPSGYCCGFRGRLRTTKLAFCGLWGKLMPHIVL